jgi:uncharacterized protein with LGFP repeats
LSRRNLLRSGALGGLAIAAAGSVEAVTGTASGQSAPGSDSAIRAYYLGCGGAAGVLGTPTGAPLPTRGASGRAGWRQHFRGSVYGAGFAVSVLIPEQKVQTSCRRPDHTGTVVESTVTWSAQTGAHAVHGNIRKRWLELGGEGGALGYPTSDEVATPDLRGRRSRFEHGEIWWYPETGAAVHHV